MTLHLHPSYPNSGAYVLKLHRDCAPQRGELIGRIEHIASGGSYDFSSASALLEWLAAHCSAQFADHTDPTGIPQ